MEAKMNLREAVYSDYAEHIRTHYEENRRAAEEMKIDLTRTPLFAHGRLIDKPLAIQKMYMPEDDALFRQVVLMTHSICCKAIRRYLEDAEYRKLFSFPEELEQLILADPGYDALLPMARFDIFYNEEDASFRFCEINTDGTSAMNEDYHLDRINIKNPAHQAIRRKYEIRSYELFDSWVQTFLSLYRTYRNPVTRPNVAIVDFLEDGNVPEFYEFARRFQKAGVDAQVVDARALRYEDGKLLSPEGYRIDAIYRRAVTSDVMAEYANVQPWIQAYLDGNVFVCGSFRSQVVHTKQFCAVIHMPQTKEILTDEERRFVEEHFPYTCAFGPEGISLEEVIRNREKYILKPNDSYGSNSVADGKERTPEEWETVCREYYGQGYICQEYAAQYATPNVDFMYGDGQFHDYINMNGLYSYNGEFAGVFTRQANGTIIASGSSERNVASYLVTGLRTADAAK